MDAVEYFKIKGRMSKICSVGCRSCPLSNCNTGADVTCTIFETLHPEEAVTIVEKWAAEHIVKTRQSEFLKMFPNTRIAIPYNFLTICPQDLDTNFICPVSKKCVECKEDYWLAEVPEAEVEE